MRAIFSMKQIYKEITVVVLTSFVLVAILYAANQPSGNPSTTASTDYRPLWIVKNYLQTGNAASVASRLLDATTTPSVLVGLDGKITSDLLTTISPSTLLTGYTLHGVAGTEYSSEPISTAESLTSICYDRTGATIEDCQLAFDDGYLATMGQDGVVINRVDNGNGTISDLSSGLMWTECPIGKTYSDGSCSGTATSQNLSQANTSCLGLSFAGSDSWRLPSQNELYSLIDFYSAVPNSNGSAFAYMNMPGGTAADSVNYVWSSTAQVQNYNRIWVLDAHTASTTVLNASGSAYAFCVRNIY